jgi:DNA repair protein RadC
MRVIPYSRFRLRLERTGDALYENPPRFDRIADAAAFLHRLVADEPHEVLGALLLDHEQRAIGHVIPFRGSLKRVHCSPAGIYGPAILANAASVVMFHNHPSGRVEPSGPDLWVTKRMVQAGVLLGIPLRDHLILGEPPRFASLAVLGHIAPHSDSALHWEVELGGLWHEDRRQAVKPKYRDPETGETWAGRGRLAGWLRRRIEAGAQLEDFRIPEEN